MKKPQIECLESPSMPLYSHNRSGAILATFLAALCAAAAIGDTLDTTPFSKKIPITISGYAGSTELTDFPVLVTLAENAPIGFSYDDCATHSTSRVTDGVLERTSLYLVEKGATRLLYATDTGGIPGDAARMLGVDPHITKGNYERFAKSGMQ